MNINVIYLRLESFLKKDFLLMSHKNMLLLFSYDIIAVSRLFIVEKDT